MNTKIELITAYKCSDGKIIEDKQDADNYQKNLNIHRLIEDLVEDECYNGMSKENVIQFIMNNINKISEILLDKNEEN